MIYSRAFKIFVSWASTKVEAVKMMSAGGMVLSRAQTAAALESARSTSVDAETMAEAGERRRRFCQRSRRESRRRQCRRPEP
jgi:hypothetical protein